MRTCIIVWEDLTEEGKAPERSRMTMNVFKENFERVSKERCGEDTSVIARVNEKVGDLREDE